MVVADIDESPTPFERRAHVRLPAQPNPLIGRDHDLTVLIDVLQREHVRLLTLSGPAGTGKTRIALGLAAATSHVSPGGVYFVDLSPIREPTLVMAALGSTLGVHELGHCLRAQGVIDAIGTRHVLLVLDNFEQVLPAAPQIGEILAACPHLRVLVTSRAALRLRWEHEFPVPPLAVPELAPLPPLDVLGAVPSVALFIQRSQAARSSFALTAGNAASVASICAHLEGLPLAIELAAALTRILSPEAMIDRLQRSQGAPRLDLLSYGSRDVAARHRTLRQAIRWSYELLAPAERAVFRTAGVFSGGFTLEAAHAVGPGGSDNDVLSSLLGLTEHSLVQEDCRPDAALRYRVLEMVREFALEELDAEGEADPGRQRHAAYFLTLAEAADRRLDGAEQPQWLERLDLEHDNLRAALGYLVQHRDIEHGQRLGLALWRFWWLRGHLSEGRRRLAEVLALESPAASRTPLRASLLVGAGHLAMWQGDYTAGRSLLSEAMSLATAVGDVRCQAYALTFLGRVARDQGDDRTARDLGAQAVGLFRTVPDTWGLAVALHFLGLPTLQADAAAARTCFEESAALFRSLGNIWDAAMPVRGLGLAAYHAGHMEQARALFEESTALFKARGDRWSQA